MRLVDTSERRARLGRRHALATAASDSVAAVRSMVVLHSSDPVTVFLSAWARVSGFTVPDLERALYDERVVLRMHGMRRTLWVVPTEWAPLVYGSSTRAVASAERRRTARMVEAGGVAEDGEAWLQEASIEILGLIAAGGEVLTRDVTRQVPRLGQQMPFYNQQGRLMGSPAVGSRALNQLGFESLLVRTRPAGTWVSGQYRWAVTESWLGAPLPQIEADDASRDLLALWLHAFGPATEVDIKWWTGWPLRQVRRALVDIEAVSVSLDDGGIGFLLPDDTDPVPTTESWVALLPSLDPTTMGWKERSWYLGPHAGALFDRNGNGGTTVWHDGRIVGGWTQRKTGEIVYEIFDDIPATARRAIAARARELEEWFGGVTVTARFPSPHEKQLGS